jgi:hypothetical protein
VPNSVSAIPVTAIAAADHSQSDDSQVCCGPCGERGPLPVCTDSPFLSVSDTSQILACASPWAKEATPGLAAMPLSLS